MADDIVCTMPSRVSVPHSHFPRGAAFGAMKRFRLAPLVRITVRTRRVEHRSAGEAIRCPGDDVAPGRADRDASCVRAELMHKLQGEKA